MSSGKDNITTGDAATDGTIGKMISDQPKAMQSTPSNASPKQPPVNVQGGVGWKSTGGGSIFSGVAGARLTRLIRLSQ